MICDVDNFTTRPRNGWRYECLCIGGTAHQDGKEQIVRELHSDAWSGADSGVCTKQYPVLVVTWGGGMHSRHDVDMTNRIEIKVF